MAAPADPPPILETNDSTVPAVPKKFADYALYFWFALAFAGGWLATSPFSGTWYSQLAKPAFSPPAWVLFPTCFNFFPLTGIAAWLLWRRHGFQKAPVALGLFLGQLLLSVAWFWIFFGGSLGTALICGLVLWLTVLAAIWAFWPRHRLAALIMSVNLAWISYMLAVNFGLWNLNH